MTKEEKRAVRISDLEAIARVLREKLGRLRELKSRLKTPGLILEKEIEIFVTKGKLQGCEDWLDQLENPLE